MKKIIMIVLIFSLKYVNSVHAQQIPWNEEGRNTFINRAAYIFEGEVIDTMYYNGVTGGRDLTVEYGTNRKPVNSIIPLTALKVKTTHIIRGDINPGTIEIVDGIGGYIEHGILTFSDIGGRSKPIPPGTNGIFFCAKSPYISSPMITDNEIKLIPTEIVGFYIENFYEPGLDFKVIGHGFMAFGKIFSSKKEFYQFLATFANISIPKEYEKNDEESKSDQGKVQDNIEKKEE